MLSFSDIAVMDQEGNPVILESCLKVKKSDLTGSSLNMMQNTIGNSTVFGSQGALTSVCPDSHPQQKYSPSSVRFSQDSNFIPSTQEEEIVLASDPSYCNERCITADSIKACGKTSFERQ